jgi:hypothetical protein
VRFGGCGEPGRPPARRVAVARLAGHTLSLTYRGTRASAGIALAGVAGFVAAMAASILLYPGGTRNTDPGGYDFLLNFLSDLGGTFTGSGRTNDGSRTFFIIAMASVAVALVALGVAARAWGRIPVVDWLPAVVGAAAGGAFLRGATIPWNVDYERHMFWVRSAFGLLGVFVFLLVVLQLRGRAPARWWILNVAFLAALGAYVVFDQQGPELMTPDGLEARVAAQKVIVAVAFANLTAQAWALRRRWRTGAPLLSTSTSTMIHVDGS